MKSNVNIKNNKNMNSHSGININLIKKIMKFMVDMTNF